MPKKNGADLVKDFRPISLVHSFAKLDTKILSNRLSVRLDLMVSKNRSTFIEKLFIQDNLEADFDPRVCMMLLNGLKDLTLPLSTTIKIEVHFTRKHRL